MGFEISNSTYDYSITYLELPNMAKANCSNNAIINFYDYFSTIESDEEVYISSGSNASVNGKIYTNQ